MDDRTLAQGLAVIANDALTSYIDVHNDVFKVEAKRLLPIPGVFEAIDLKAHVETVAEVEDTLVRTGVTIATAMDRGVEDPEARRFLETLDTYRTALLEAVRQFKTILGKLYRKSQDPTVYKWGTYQKDLDSYQQSIERYTELGAELNTAYQRIT